MYLPADSINALSVHAPYWAKVWPASIALCYYLHDNPALIQNKLVMELAAGLGLPSIFAAATASQVYSSDIEPEAVNMLVQSAKLNGLLNIDGRVIDWESPDKTIIPDTLLLSDINYNPVQFEKLEAMILHYLYRQTTVVLSSPQRLMAKPFINLLLPYCKHSEMIPIDMNNTITDISIFLLRK